MDFKSAIFYVFAAVLVFAALRVVTSRNPVHSALFLVLSFFSAAGIWLLLEAEFLAIALVLVYVGAVMVLFLFVVMMLDINIDEMRQGFWRNLPVALVVGVFIVVEMAMLLFAKFGGVRDADAPALAPEISNTEVLGRLIYTEYVYPFELAAVLLLVAIVAAIALTLRRRKDSKYQNPSAQIKVRASDRLRLVSMPAQRRERAGDPGAAPPSDEPAS